MPSLTKIAENEAYETYLIEDASLDALMDECMKRIRSKSKAFYEKELRKELGDSGKSFIDHHAGMGIFYKVVLK